jgi:NAD(P)-dependent dehydrogenase (short-subunit alcohol dehydrogenase family)
MRGKSVLITGAARGIGAETARQLAKKGARVALLGLEPEELKQVAAECGPDAVWFEVDVTDREALDRAVSAAVESLGGLDVVVANAGIASGAFVRSMDPDEWERVIDVNLKGVYRTVQACLPHVIERRGYIVNIASMAAIAHAPLLSAYCASKAGVEAFSNALRTEVAHHGVDVGVAYFSWIDTDMVRGMGEHPAQTEMRGTLKGPLGRTTPLPVAIKALVKGIEKRSRIVVTPRWIRLVLPFRGLVQPLAERETKKLMPRIEQVFEQEVAERGARASAPVGAGGAAAVEAESPERATAAS